VIQGALLCEEELQKAKCNHELLGLMEREGRGKLSEGKSTKSEESMGCGRVSYSGENCEHHNGRGEITAKTKRTPHHPYLRMCCHVLATRIVGEPPAFRGKPCFCEKNTVKRRKEKKR
jgi:hypothetical protein